MTTTQITKFGNDILKKVKNGTVRYFPGTMSSSTKKITMVDSFIDDYQQIKIKEGDVIVVYNNDDATITWEPTNLPVVEKGTVASVFTIVDLSNFGGSDSTNIIKCTDKAGNEVYFDASFDKVLALVKVGKRVTPVTYTLNLSTPGVKAGILKNYAPDYIVGDIIIPGKSETDTFFNGTSYEVVYTNNVTELHLIRYYPTNRVICKIPFIKAGDIYVPSTSENYEFTKPVTFINDVDTLRDATAIGTAMMGDDIIDGIHFLDNYLLSNGDTIVTPNLTYIGTIQTIHYGVSENLVASGTIYYHSSVFPFTITNDLDFSINTGQGGNTDGSN